MTTPNPELKEIDSTPRPIHVKTIDPTDKESFREWLDLRQDFVEAQGWRSGDDYDVCDADPATLHIVTTQNDKIGAGLRLTPCARPQETLSWTMLTPEMRREAEANMPADKKERGWDLTRLVVGENIDKDQLVPAFMEMLGAGYAMNDQVDGDPRWYFTTTVGLFMFFKRQGIEFTPLTRGQISPSDDFESVFCYANPAEQVERLKMSPNERHQANYLSVLRGIHSVEKAGSVAK